MSDEIKIIRVERNTQNPYFMMVRRAAQNRALSWEARGVLAYLLSQPDDWQVQPKDLEQGCGRDKARNILDELKAAGHLVIRQSHTEKGTFAPGEYVVYESPITENPYTVVSPVQPITEKPLTAKPLTVNPHLHNSINTHNRIKTTEKKKKEKMDLQSAPSGASAKGASARNSRNSSSKSKTTGDKLPKPGKKEKKNPPPSPSRKRKTDLEKLLERAAAVRPMMDALLRQFETAYDPVMFKGLEEYCTLSTLEKYVPEAEDLTRIGCQPGEIAEIYAHLKPGYEKRGWVIGLKTISQKYQDFKAWKTKQTQSKAKNAAGRGGRKILPVVEKQQTPEEAAAMLNEMRQLRGQIPA